MDERVNGVDNAGALRSQQHLFLVVSPETGLPSPIASKAECPGCAHPAPLARPP